MGRNGERTEMTRQNQGETKNGERKDRRRSQRFLLRVEAWFEWQSASGQWRKGLGLTRNMGREGMFVETEMVPPMVSQLKVVVTLAGGPEDEIQARLCGMGGVRHVQREGGVANGFGAWVHFRTEAAEQLS